MFNSMQNRLILAIVACVLFATFTLDFALSYVSKQAQEEEIGKVQQKSLIAKRELVKREVEQYFEHIENQIVDLSSNKVTQEAAKEFISSFNNFSQQYQADSNSVSSSLANYYNGDFASTYKTQNAYSVDTSPLLSGLSSTGSSLQHAYISNNPLPLGSKDELTESAMHTDYGVTHAKYHADFRRFAKQFGYYDIFLVDANTGDVVYSVYKELDYATNLKSGAYADSGLAKAFNQALTLPKDQFHLTDFSAYVPSYSNPASFISSPVFSDGTLSAVLIFQMPIDRINGLLTSYGKWQEVGFGDSGETYLVGSDKTLRSESRFFVEDKAAYVQALTQSNAKLAAEIDRKNTSITLQSVDSIGVQKALKGEEGFAIFNDYRGNPVLSAYSPIELAGMRWAILAEIDEAEAFASLDALNASMKTASVIIGVALTLLAAVASYVVARSFVKPLLELEQQFKNISHGDGDLSQRLPSSTLREVNAINTQFNHFIEMLSGVFNTVKESATSLASASEELSNTTKLSAQNANQQKQESESVQRALVQFNEAISSVNESSERASSETENSKTLTFETNDESQKANEQVTNLVSQVQESAGNLRSLQSEVDNINEVLAVINSIADQTNLLALNAAIEAARAGEHGRGFAVVADEVRQLASRTQESTIDIQHKTESLNKVAKHAADTMDSASNAAVKSGEYMQQVGNKLSSLRDGIESLSTINQSVATATNQQQQSCAGISANMDNVLQASLQLNRSSDDVASAAQSLAVIAEDLQQNVGKFKT